MTPGERHLADTGIRLVLVIDEIPVMADKRYGGGPCGGTTYLTRPSPERQIRVLFGDIR